MQAQEFVYWLQGFLEVADPKTITEQQLQVIKDHISLVLTKVTPARSFTWSDIKSHPIMDPNIMFCSNMNNAHAKNNGVAPIEFDGREPKICNNEAKEKIDYDPFVSSVNPRPNAGIVSWGKDGQPPASC